MLGAASAVGTALATDPVCGMSVDPATSKHRHTHAGALFHFCSARCQQKFIADPARYLTPSAADAEPAPSKGVIYTCPMHPEIRRNGPGICPICGMALEPLTVSGDAGPNVELIDMTQRFWIGLALTVPVVVLEMGGHLPWLHLHDHIPATIATWLQCALATPVVLWVGWPFFVRAWASVVN